MSDATEINEKIDFFRNKINVWENHPTVVEVMKLHLSLELKKLADLKSKPMTAIMFGAVEDCAEIARARGNNTVKDKDVIAGQHRIEQERMINNDLIPVMMENKVVKVPGFNSKCCICSMPCNKKGKISICDGGCK